jgi:hypothetical protein
MATYLSDGEISIDLLAVSYPYETFVGSISADTTGISEKTININVKKKAVFLFLNDIMINSVRLIDFI